MGIRTEPDICGQDLAAHSLLRSEVTDAVLPPRVGFQGHSGHTQHTQDTGSLCALPVTLTGQTTQPSPPPDPAWMPPAWMAPALTC